MANKTIGQFIAALRKSNGMTQKDVADRLSVSNKAVSRWERDECAPDISLIPALAEIFGVTCDEILKGERIFEQPQTEKRAPKIEKQLKSIVNRTIMDFRTMIWISLALSAVGLICMFGISYGFYRPIIGLTVMFLFDVVAVVVAAIATNRMKEMKTDNELFESAEQSLIDRFNKNLGSFSFAAFFTAFSVILLSVPLAIFRDSYFEDSVLSFNRYIFYYFWEIALFLILVHFIAKDRYDAWITGQPYDRQKACSNPVVNRMALFQIGAVILAGISFIVAPYFESASPDESSVFTIIIELLGGVFLCSNTICFIVYMIKYKNDRNQLILPGIRNVLFTVSAYLMGGFHGAFYSTYDGTESDEAIWYKDDYWNFEYLIYSIIVTVVIIFVFKIIDIITYKNRNRKHISVLRD